MKREKKRQRKKMNENKKRNTRETADTSGEGETLPDPQGAGVPA